MEDKELTTKIPSEEDDSIGDFCGSIVDPNIRTHDVNITELIFDDPNSIERDESE